MKITDNQRKMIMSMCTQQGIDDDLRSELAFQFSTCRTTHISELKSNEASELISKLKQTQSATNQTLDVWRKRLMGAIGGYLDAHHYTNNAETIKAIACRAAQVDDFNKIPADRLRSLYNAFKNRERDAVTVDLITTEFENVKQLMN